MATYIHLTLNDEVINIDECNETELVRKCIKDWHFVMRLEISGYVTCVKETYPQWQGVLLMLNRYRDFLDGNPAPDFDRNRAFYYLINHLRDHQRPYRDVYLDNFDASATTRGWNGDYHFNNPLFEDSRIINTESWQMDATGFTFKLDDYKISIVDMMFYSADHLVGLFNEWLTKDAEEILDPMTLLSSLRIALLSMNSRLARDRVEEINRKLDSLAKLTDTMMEEIELEEQQSLGED